MAVREVSAMRNLPGFLKATDKSGTGCLAFSRAASQAGGLAAGGSLHDGQLTVALVHPPGLDEGNRIARRETVLEGLVELVVDLVFEGLVGFGGHVPLRCRGRQARADVGRAATNASATNVRRRSLLAHGQGNPQKDRRQDRQKDNAPPRRPEMVGQGDPRKPCARARKGCLRREEPPRHRPLAEALGGAQPCAQIRAVAVGDLDVDLLYQPRGLGPVGHAAQDPGGSQRRVAQAVRQGEDDAVRMSSQLWGSSNNWRIRATSPGTSASAAVLSVSLSRACPRLARRERVMLTSSAMLGRSCTSLASAACPTS